MGCKVKENMNEDKKTVLQREDTRRLLGYLAPAVVPTNALSDGKISWGSKGIYSTLWYLKQLHHLDTIPISFLESDYGSKDLNDHLLELISKNYISITDGEIEICQ